MSDDKLVRMANDIANFFKPYGEADAIAGVRHHILSFWTPGMRQSLAKAIAAGRADALHPVAMAALRDDAPEAGSPARRESAGPDTAGELGASDAG